MTRLTPILLVAGGIESILIQAALEHRSVTVGPDGVVTLVDVLATLFTGYLFLAIID